MAKSAVYKRGLGGKLDFNMTPMIDVTFQLIVFFILAGRIASQALAQLKLHKPHESQALREKDLNVPNKVIVNVVSKGKKEPGEDDPFLAGAAKHYQVGNKKIKLHEVESDLLRVFNDRLARARGAGHQEFYVEIRADKRVNFKFVEPVMLAAANAGIPKMNISALLHTGD